MTIVLAVVLVLAVAAFIVSPLLQETAGDAADKPSGGNELWKREKAVAVLAIAEADFDRATGKLSDDDYRVLRSDYEGRALHAMDEMERLAAPDETSIASFCGACGKAFAAADSFCGACGRPRFPRG